METAPPNVTGLSLGGQPTRLARGPSVLEKSQPTSSVEVVSLWRSSESQAKFLFSQSTPAARPLSPIAAMHPHLHTKNALGMFIPLSSASRSNLPPPLPPRLTITNNPHSLRRCHRRSRGVSRKGLHAQGRRQLQQRKGLGEPVPARRAGKGPGRQPRHRPRKEGEAQGVAEGIGSVKEEAFYETTYRDPRRTQQPNRRRIDGPPVPLSWITSEQWEHMGGVLRDSC